MVLSLWGSSGSVGTGRWGKSIFPGKIPGVLEMAPAGAGADCGSSRSDLPLPGSDQLRDLWDPVQLDRVQFAVFDAGAGAGDRHVRSPTMVHLPLSAGSGAGLDSDDTKLDL